MAKVNPPKHWKMLDVVYRPRFLFYQMLSKLPAKDRNESKLRAEMLNILKDGDDDLLPAIAMNADTVNGCAAILQQAGADKKLLKQLGEALKRKSDDDPRTLKFDVVDAEQLLDMYDDFLGLSEEKQEGMGRMGVLHRVTPIVKALEAAKSGNAIEGVVEPVELVEADGNSGKAKALPEPEPMPMPMEDEEKEAATG